MNPFDEGPAKFEPTTPEEEAEMEREYRAWADAIASCPQKGFHPEIVSGSEDGCEHCGFFAT